MIVRYGWVPLAKEPVFLSPALEYEQAMILMADLLQGMEVLSVWWPIDLCPWTISDYTGSFWQPVFWHHLLLAVVVPDSQGVTP